MAVAILFDLDNTLVNTNKLTDIRETGEYEQLTSERLNQARIYKPIIPLLEHLKENKIPLGIVTNSGKTYCDRILEHFDLAKYFSAVITYSDVKQQGQKPSAVGINKALKKLGVAASNHVIFIGDTNLDIIAAYKARITPVLPSWGSKEPVSTCPAIEMSSNQVKDFIKNPHEYVSIAERVCEHESIKFSRKGANFFPLDEYGNVVTMRDQMKFMAFGRYFSKKSVPTAILHNNHKLSLEIAKKVVDPNYEIPNYFSDMFYALINGLSSYIEHTIDIITVIPRKSDKPLRLELLLKAIQAQDIDNSYLFIEDYFYFEEGARSLKTLPASEREIEIEASLKVNAKYKDTVKGKNILVIDDVITTGSTLRQATTLLTANGAEFVFGLVLAKTVSIREEETSCPVCGRNMVVRRNKGTEIDFLGCSGYLEKIDQCTHTQPISIKECPKCERPMELKYNKAKGVKFLACTGYAQTPSCTHTENHN